MNRPRNARGRFTRRSSPAATIGTPTSRPRNERGRFLKMSRKNRRNTRRNTRRANRR